MNQKWITCWAKAQRGMGLVPQLYQPHQCISMRVPKAAAFTLRFASFYDRHEIIIANARCISKGKQCTVTFQQRETWTMRPQTLVVSDEVTFDEEVEELTILYDLICENDVSSGIQLQAYDEVTAHPPIVYALCGVDALTSHRKGCIGVIGDSISEQGHWTAPISRWLSAQGYCLLNHSISGNRLMRRLEHVTIDPPHAKDLDQKAIQACDLVGVHEKIALEKQCFGVSGIQRIKEQVMRQETGVALHLLALGTNDLYQPGTFCAAPSELPADHAFVAAAMSAIELLQSSAPCLVLCIPPFLHADSINAHKEQLRKTINQTLQQSPLIASAVAFDDCLMDEEGALQTRYHQGDHLHPNALGGQVMANQLQEVLQQWLG